MSHSLRIALLSLYALENNGVRSVAASLRRAGFPVTEIYFKDWKNNHFPFPTEAEVETLLATLRDRHVGIVALSVRASAFHRIASHLTHRIRTALHLPVVWGGMHPTFLPDRAIQQADAICLGEADQGPAADFFGRWERREGVRTCPGFWVREGDRVWKNDLPPMENDLDRLPFRDFHSADDKLFIDGTRVVRGDPFIDNPEYTTLASRGCPYWTCSYCSNSYTRPLYHGLGRDFRVRSPENVVQELEYARRHARRIRFVRFDDEVFPCGEAWVETFVDLWKRRVNLPFEILVDPRMVREEPLARLKEAGLRALCMGVQHTERVSRSLYDRDVSNARIVECQRIFRKVGVRSSLQVIWDDPVSTEEDKDTLFRMFMEMERPFEIYLFGLTLYPNTHLARRLLREGLVTPDQIEGEDEHAFRQFRVDLSHPRPPADRRWLALLVLLNKPFVPKDLVWRLYREPRFRDDPGPLVALAQAANLAHMARVAAGLARRGEVSPLLLRRWLNLRSLVTM